jgi:hypothetical protein
LEQGAEENIWAEDSCVTRSFITALFVIYNLNDQIIGDEMGRAYSTHKEEEECMQDCRGKSRKKETHPEDFVVCGGIIVWPIDQFLCDDRETNNKTTAVARQQIVNK